MHVFYYAYASPDGLCAEDNSLSENQMLIKRKLHWIGERKTGKIHPGKPHRSSQEGGERERRRQRDSRRMNRGRKRDGQERDRKEKRKEKIWLDLRN